MALEDPDYVGGTEKNNNYILSDIIKENKVEQKYSIYKCTGYDLCAVQLNEENFQFKKDSLDEREIQTVLKIFDSLVSDPNIVSQSSKHPNEAIPLNNTHLVPKDDAKISEIYNAEVPLTASPVSRSCKGVMLYESFENTFDDLIVNMSTFNDTLPSDQRYNIFSLSIRSLILNIGDDMELRGESGRVGQHVDYIKEYISNIISPNPGCDKIILVFDYINDLLELKRYNDNQFFTLKLIGMMGVDNSEEIKKYKKNILSILECTKQ